MLSKIDPNQPVDIRIDGATYEFNQVMGDELTFPVVPGTHEILMQYRFEKPVTVNVPANRTVLITVSRNLIWGSVKVLRTETL